MKSIIAPLIIAIVLAIAGAGFWIAGQTEKRLADVHHELATLQYTAATSDSEDVESELGAARRVPQVGDAAVADLRDTRATASYWSGGYGAIAPQKDANGAVTETDPQILLLVANASFRGGQAESDRATALRRLDGVVKSYGDVLRNSPGHQDAAYNYEYAIRVRDNLAKAKPAAAARNAKAQPKPEADVAGDLPSGATLHGKPGGPPAATDMAQFKIVIPKRGEERKDNPEAGKGGVKVRKG
jgi:hypothetical protein